MKKELFMVLEEGHIEFSESNFCVFCNPVQITH